MKALLLLTLLSGNVAYASTKANRNVPKDPVEYSRQKKQEVLPQGISFFEALFTNSLTINEATISYPDYNNSSKTYTDTLGTALSDNHIELLMYGQLVSEKTIDTLSTDLDIRLLEITAQLQLSRFGILEDNTDTPAILYERNRASILKALKSSDPKKCRLVKDLPLFKEQLLPITTVVMQFLQEHPEHGINLG